MRARPTGPPRPGRGCGGAPARAVWSRAPRRPAGRRPRRRAPRRRRRVPVRLGVEQHPRLAVAPQLHRLAAMGAGVAEPERGEGARDRGLALVVHGDLGEREAVQPRRGRQAPPADLDAGRQVALGRVPDRFGQREQRPQGVDRGPARVGLAEHVVEHLERQRPAVARGQHVAEEGGQVEGALAREEAVVAAPLEHVHVHVRGVGQLQEEQLLPGDVADACRVAAAGQDVEAVDAQAQRRVVRAAHDLPRPVVGVHVPAPGQRLVRHAHSVRAGPLGQGVQLLGDAAVVVDGVGGDRGADQDQVGAQRLHDGELVLGAPQVRRQPLRVDRVEVAEGLVEVDREAQVGAAPPDLRRRRGRRDEVRLEDLDAVEARRGGRGELVLQRAGQADGGDGGARGSQPGPRVRIDGPRGPGGHGHPRSPLDAAASAVASLAEPVRRR